MFINYTPTTGITISKSRATGAYFGEICDVAEAVTYNHELACCDLEGAKDTINDGAYWQGRRVSAEALEMIHEAIIQATESDQMLRQGNAPDA